MNHPELSDYLKQACFYPQSWMLNEMWKVSVHSCTTFPHSLTQTWGFVQISFCSSQGDVSLCCLLNLIITRTI